MRRGIVILSSFLILGLAGGTVAYADWIEREKPIMKGVGWNYPLADSKKMIFDPGTGKAKGGTYIYDIVKDKLTSTRTIPGATRALYGNKIVFLDGGKIYLYGIDSRKTVEIGKGSSSPDIYEDTVIYEDDGELVIYDLKKKKAKRVEIQGKMQNTGYPRFLGPRMHRGTVVWIEKTGEGTASLLSYDIATGKTKKLIDGGWELINPTVFMFRDDIILLSNQDDVFICKMKDGTYKQLTRPGSRVFLSNINMGKVVWDSNGGEFIYLYDIAKDEYTELVSKGASVHSPAVSGNKVFFVDLNKYELRVFEYKTEKKTRR